MSAAIVIGLGFGDEGKGSVVDYLCRQSRAPLVVRFSGGSQAAHNVVTPEGRHHTFHQIGSGALAGARTLLSRFMMLDPVALAFEVAELAPKIGENPLDSLFIDAQCPVITPYHVAANRARASARGASCGMGIGDLAYDLLYQPGEVLRAGELRDRGVAAGKLAAIRDRKARRSPDEPQSVAQAYAELADRYQILATEQAAAMLHGDLIFEGSQGVLLDETHGWHPFTTWSTVTDKNARDLLNEAGYRGPIETMGVVRTYGTRHGAGPFPSEIASPGFSWDGEHNGAGPWQGDFRVGAFDLVMLRYALQAARPDSLALTHSDALARGIPVVDAYRMDGRTVRDLPPAGDLGAQERIGARLFAAEAVTSETIYSEDGALDHLAAIGAPSVALISSGPTADQKRRLTTFRPNQQED